MSRYEDRDYDRENYGGPRRRGGNGDDRLESDYGRGESLREREYGSDDPYGTRGGRGLGGRDYGRDYVRDYVREDYGRGRYGERADYRNDESHYTDASATGRGYEDEGRSLWEETRDYVRGRTETRRGAARSHVRCRDIMTRDVTAATRDTTLREVARMMKEEDTGVIPVVDRGDIPVASGEVSAEARRVNNRIYNNGRLVGLITDRDIVIRTLAEDKDPATARAEEIMTTDIYTAQPNDRVVDALRKMGDKQVRRIPIVDNDHNLIGIISMADIALETEADQELAGALEEISSGKSFWSRIFG